MLRPRELWRLARQAVDGYSEDRVASMGAALAYYTAFSLAPLLIIAIAIAGMFFGRDAAQQALLGQLQGLLGDAGGAAVEDILKSASDFGSGSVELIISVGALILGATTSFVELQDDLDRIWKAEPRAGSGIFNLIRSRLLSFGMVLLIGFLLTVSLALSAAVSALGRTMFSEMEIVLQVVTFVLSFATVTLLFAMIYKVLPNVEIDWEDVWVGAAITALLFEIGKFLIGLYIGKSSVISSFGAAGPFVVVMLWIYYSTQIFLFGAEFTFAHAVARDPQLRRQVQKSAGRGPPVPGRDRIPAAPSARAGVPADEAGTTIGTGDPGPSRAPWLRRLWGASAAGLIAGFTVARFVRSASPKIK
jgi:membrane protein